MNILAHGLLGLLTNEPLTGYDLMLKMNLFWHTSHSHIYPLLSKLEHDGYVKYTLVKQNDKPDKKVYSLTDKGFTAVKDWLMSSTDEPVLKDEMMLKTCCIHILDKASAKKLLLDRKRLYKDQLELLEKMLKELKVQKDSENTQSPLFGRYILLQKKIAEVESGIQWCRWVYSIYEESTKIKNFS